MPYETLLYELKDRIARVTVNRPEKLNALNAKARAELAEVFASMRDDEQVGGVILTGAGEKAFIAGADINELAQMGPVEARDFAVRAQALLHAIETYPKPVIAAINGFALGGGCELAMACHIRIASDNAKLGQPEVNLGIIPGYGGTQRLPRLVGKGRALELILTGEMIDAQEAYRIGLVNKVVPRADLIPTAEGLLQTILSRGPLAVRLAIEAIHYGLETSLAEGIHLEADLFGLCFATEEMREGTRAFLEKRKPNFRGK